MPKKPIYQIFLKNPMKKGALLELYIEFSGVIWETAEGLFKGSYSDSNGDKRYNETDKSDLIDAVTFEHSHRLDII